MSKIFNKTFTFRGYQSGEYDDGFCFAIPPEDYEAIAGEWDEYNLSRHHKGLLNLFPDKLLPGYELKHQAYQFKITVEAIPIDNATLQPRSPKALEMFKERFSRFLEDEAEST